MLESWRPWSFKSGFWFSGCLVKCSL